MVLAAMSFSASSTSELKGTCFLPPEFHLAPLKWRPGSSKSGSFFYGAYACAILRRMSIDLSSNPHYLAAFERLGTKVAARSGLSYLKHVREGVEILRRLDASPRAVDAFCLHPLVQSDEELVLSLSSDAWLGLGLDPLALATAMEYRSVANAYLSIDPLRSPESVKLSPLRDVNDMLIADKVQNRKDFELHNADHPRAAHLTAYFESWLDALGITDADYRDLISGLGS